MWSDWLVICNCGFSLSALWCPLLVPTILLEFLLPWTWGISSWLLQQSTAAAPSCLGRNVSPLGCRSWPWTWGSSCATQTSLLCRAATTPVARGEKERYTHLNAEFQRIAKRDKKAFLSDQCKEIEENNRTGKTTDLFKKIRGYQGNISCKDGLDKGQKWYGPNRRRRY